MDARDDHRFPASPTATSPIERELRLTRGCLEVAAECRQPVGIITKNALVTRDLDVLRELAAHRAVHVAVSVTTLDQELARVMEPRTSSPAARLRAIAELSAAGVPTMVMTPPIIPGLNDHEIPAHPRRGRAKPGACCASYHAGAAADDRAGRVSRLAPPPSAQSGREGRALHPLDARAASSTIPISASAIAAEGPMADQIAQTFKVFAKRHGLQLTARTAQRCGLPPAAANKRPAAMVMPLRADADVLLKLSPSGKFLAAFGGGLFVQPHGLYIDRDGNIWATDVNAKDGIGHQVFKFSPDGKVVMRLGKAGVAGEGADTFNQPSAVVVAPNGDIFVADGHIGDNSNHRIVKFTKDGKFIKTWGKHGKGPGEFDGPHAVAIDSRGRVFVAIARTAASRSSIRTENSSSSGNSSAARVGFSSTKTTRCS